MITKEQRIEAMKGVLASLFASQRILSRLLHSSNGQVWAICLETMGSSLPPKSTDYIRLRDGQMATMR